MSEPVTCFMRNWRCDLPEGPLLITRPMPLTGDSAADALAFLELFRKQLQREAGAKGEENV